MTLNGQNALCRRKDASLGAHCTNVNEDRPILLSDKKCRPMNLVSGNILRFMGIFAVVPLSGGVKAVKWQWGCQRRQFLAICVATSSETLEIRPAILHGDMLPLVCR